MSAEVPGSVQTGQSQRSSVRGWSDLDADRSRSGQRKRHRPPKAGPCAVGGTCLADSVVGGVTVGLVSGDLLAGAGNSFDHVVAILVRQGGRDLHD